MPITALYAALLAPLLVILAIRVIAVRRAAGLSLGDGGNPDLLRRIRAHANFAEYAPFSLILMALAESLATSPWILHGLGVLLLGGRLSHAVGVSTGQQSMPFRSAGMALTFTMLVAAALACIVGSLARLG